MAGADGEDTFMKNSADTDVARLRNNNFWDGEILIWTPFHDPVYFQHPNSCGSELPSPAHIFLLSSPIIHETSWEKLSHTQGALMKSTSLSERVWKNNGGTEIITLHSALGFNTFLIKVSLAGWITTVILDALLIKASHAGTEKTLHFIIIFAWDMARGKECWKSSLTSQSLIWSKLPWIRVFADCNVVYLKSGLNPNEKKIRKLLRTPNTQRTTGRWLLYRLICYMVTHWISRGLGIGKGEGCGFSLSQFNNELRLSGPGQPWGDPSEKD